MRLNVVILIQAESNRPSLAIRADQTLINQESDEELLANFSIILSPCASWLRFTQKSQRSNTEKHPVLNFHCQCPGLESTAGLTVAPTDSNAKSRDEPKSSEMCDNRVSHLSFLISGEPSGLVISQVRTKRSSSPANLGPTIMMNDVDLVECILLLFIPLCQLTNHANSSLRDHHPRQHTTPTSLFILKVAVQLDGARRMTTRGVGKVRQGIEDWA
ncbi:hypothetical protein BUE80_DR001043 [Diplocarpon rosae]|nr:hypothetical protein BUE80_DR001043 [Diplocarpon rosae]